MIELPDVGQRAERDVEGPFRPFADLPRLPQDVAHVRGNRHRLHAGRGVDADDVAGGTPGAHERFEPLELGEHRIERRARGLFVGGPGGQPQLGSHRHADAFDRAYAARLSC